MNLYHSRSHIYRFITNINYVIIINFNSCMKIVFKNEKYLYNISSENHLYIYMCVYEYMYEYMNICFMETLIFRDISITLYCTYLNSG